MSAPSDGLSIINSLSYVTFATGPVLFRHRPAFQKIKLRPKKTRLRRLSSSPASFLLNGPPRGYRPPYRPPLVCLSGRTREINRHREKALTFKFKKEDYLRCDWRAQTARSCCFAQWTCIKGEEEIDSDPRSQVAGRCFKIECTLSVPLQTFLVNLGRLG